jgi:hypothetical protein
LPRHWSRLPSSEFQRIAASGIKQRILASADLNPHLVNCITDGRSLNVVKALSLHQDVIELRPPRQNVLADDADCSSPLGAPPAAAIIARKIDFFSYLT